MFQRAEGAIRQPKPFGRHFAVNGTIILIVERRDEVQAVGGVTRVVFMLIVICLGHIFFLLRSVSLAKLALMILLKTEQLFQKALKFKRRPRASFCPRATIGRHFSKR
jgi:hypothetical protein